MIRKYLSTAALALLATSSSTTAFTPVSLSQHYLATSSTTSTAGPTDSSTTALECGIFGIFGSAKDEPELRSHLISCSSELRHRGPDWSGEFTLRLEHLDILGGEHFSQ